MSAFSHCYLCQSEQPKRVYARVGEHVLLQCPACQFIWIKQGKAEELIALYEEEDYYTKKGGSGFSVDGFLNENGEDPLSRHYSRYRLQPIADHFAGRSTPIRHLDLGCSAGHLLGLSKKRGWLTEGVDASPVAVSFARERLGLTVQQGNLDEVKFKEHSFDVISLFHVMEHLMDPRNMLKKIHSWLSDDGVLAVEIPNIRSLPAMIRKKSWHGYVLPYHLWHFSPKTATLLLEQAGFRVVQIQTPFSPFQTSHIFNIHRTLASVVRKVLPRRTNPSPSAGTAHSTEDSSSVPISRPSAIATAFETLYWPTDYLMSRLGFGENLYILAVKQ